MSESVLKEEQEWDGEEKSGFPYAFLNAQERGAFSEIFVTRVEYKENHSGRPGAQVRETLFPQ